VNTILSDAYLKEVNDYVIKRTEKDLYKALKAAGEAYKAAIAAKYAARDALEAAPQNESARAAYSTAYQALASASDALEAARASACAAYEEGALK